MALEGSLKDFGLADILQMIFFQRKTGILSIEGRMDKVRLFFYEGNVTAAESKRRSEPDRLGKLLVKKGVVREEELKNALSEQRAKGTKLGNILIKNGLVSREQIQEGLVSQITETVVQLFSWKEGLYEFSPQGVPLDKEIPVSLDTQHLLMEGLRVIDEWSLIEGKFTLDTVFVRTGKTGIEFNPDEKEIIGYIDGESDAGSIIEASGADNFLVSKALVSLIEKRVIEPVETAPVAPVIAPARTEPLKKVSLIRFLVPCLFLLCIMIAVVSSFMQFGGDLQRIKSGEDIDGIRFRIEAYRYEKGSYPASLDQINKASDGWGRPYIYRTESDNYTVFSSGPDGKEGTGDDVY